MVSFNLLKVIYIIKQVSISGSAAGTSIKNHEK